MNDTAILNKIVENLSKDIEIQLYLLILILILQLGLIFSVAAYIYFQNKKAQKIFEMT
jgi:hypothetical protein